MKQNLLTARILADWRSVGIPLDPARVAASRLAAHAEEVNARGLSFAASLATYRADLALLTPADASQAAYIADLSDSLANLDAALRPVEFDAHATASDINDQVLATLIEAAGSAEDLKKHAQQYPIGERPTRRKHGGISLLGQLLSTR